MKLVAPFVLIIAALAVTVAVDDTPPRADLVIVNRSDVFTLDPQRQSYLHDFRMSYALYEGLVRWRTDDFTIEPAAAERFEIGRDGRTWTFRIRDDARWSSGAPVTAHDFVYSWMRLLLPETAADYSNLMFCVDGAQAFWRWRTEQLEALARAEVRDGAERAAQAEALWLETERRFEAEVGIRALDDRTLVVRLERPTAYFLDLACFAVCCPVYRPCVEGWPQEAARAAAADPRGWVAVTPPPWSQRRWATLSLQTGRLEQQHQWARPGSLVSNGPYVLARWRYKRDLRLERNPHYHSPELVRSGSVAIRTIEDANTRVLAFEAGGIDWLAEVGAEYEPDMLEQGRPDIHALPAFGIDFYSFNCRPTLDDGRANPFHDARVRRAFTLAVDRRAIVEQVTRLHEPVITSLVPPGSIPGYESPEGLGHDPARARRELEAAGWADRDEDGTIEDGSGRAFPIVEVLWTTSSERYKWISLALQAQWQETLGVRVELRGTDTKFYKEDLRQGRFMIARGRWYGDYGDPTTFLDLCRSTDGNNDRGFADPRVDAMLDAAAVERDPRRRFEILEACERIIVQEQAPMVVLCQLVQVYMFDPDRLRGLSRHPRLVQYLWQMDASRDGPETSAAADGGGQP